MIIFIEPHFLNYDERLIFQPQDLAMKETTSLLHPNLIMSFILFLICLLNATISLADEREIKTVISEGLGKDVPSAAQNAAKNALTNVVGSFMDASQLLEKRAVIQEGVRTEVSRIDTNIKEYSQGSIKAFEILETSEQNSLILVTAKVSVRIESFKAYIEDISKGEAPVQSGKLFAKATEADAIKITDERQSANKSALMRDNIIIPLNKGYGISVNVGDLRRLNREEANSLLKNSKPSVHPKNINRFTDNLGDHIYSINIKLGLSPEFLNDIKKILSNISSKSQVISFGSSGSSADNIGKALQEYNFIDSSIANKNIILVGLKSKSPGNMEVFLIPDVDPNFTSDLTNSEKNLKLEVSLLDDQDNVMQDFLFKPKSKYQPMDSGTLDWIDVTGGKGVIGSSNGAPLHMADPIWNPSSLVTVKSKIGLQIVQHTMLLIEGGNEKSFDVVMGIDTNTISRANKIGVNLIP